MISAVCAAAQSAAEAQLRASVTQKMNVNAGYAVGHMMSV